MQVCVTMPALIVLTIEDELPREELVKCKRTSRSGFCNFLVSVFTPSLAKNLCFAHLGLLSPGMTCATMPSSSTFYVTAWTVKWIQSQGGRVPKSLSPLE